jgi:chemotaxis protein CheC
VTEPRPPDLDELERDALTELVNLGVGRAALSLRAMAGEEVVLTVPAISTVSPQQAAEMIGGARIGQLVAVEQYFDGEISGRALLIFPETNSLDLVRAVLPDDIPAEQLPSIAPEALCETGNVLLQACLGTIANMLQRTLGLSTPQLIRGRASELFPRSAAGVVLFIYINFSLRGRRVRGYVALLMDLPSMTALKALVGDFVKRQTE